MSVMDHSKYRFENFEGRPNVWIGYHLGGTYTATKFNPLVLEVARIMFKKAPKNTYVFTGPSSNNEVAQMYRCTVERDGEHLGFIAYAQGRKGASVLVDNDRIRQERERGGGMVTSDAKRAAALAIKKFLPTSSEEALLKQYSKINEDVRNLAFQAQARKRDALGTQAARITAYVEQNWPKEGKKLLDKIGVPPSEIDGIDKAILDHQQYATLRARGEKGLTFVLQKGDTLYAVPFNLTTASVYDLHQRAFAFDDAPDLMRVEITKLKLAEPDTYVHDVGYRIGDNSFVVFFDLDDVKEEAESESEDDPEEEQA